MKVAIIGAGATGSIVAHELAERGGGELSLTLLDHDLRNAERLVRTIACGKVDAVACDASQSSVLARALDGVGIVVNAAQHEVNLPIMSACLKVGAHYLDLGGLYHTTLEQLSMHKDFQAAGLTAVLGMGAAPGVTNVVARYLVDELDSVDSIEASFAMFSEANGDTEAEVFVPPYSIQTLMHEFSDPSIQFLDGAHRELPPLEGLRQMTFPDPIGAVTCVYTLHSEPATLPDAFAAKGIRQVTWRLGLPASLEARLRHFVSAGLHRSEPFSSDPASLSPLEALAASIERNLRDNPPSGRSRREVGCLRIEVAGSREQMPVRHQMDCILDRTGTDPNVSAIITGVPAAAATLLIAQGHVNCPGVHGPEDAIPPHMLMAIIEGRGFRFELSRKEFLQFQRDADFA